MNLGVYLKIRFRKIQNLWYQLVSYKEGNFLMKSEVENLEKWISEILNYFVLPSI